MIKSFIKGIKKKYYFKAYDLFKGTQTNEIYQFYLSTLNWSKDRIEAYQVEQIYDLLKFANDNNKYYQKRFHSSGFNIESFKYLDQLKKLPVLTRKDIQNNFSDLCSNGFDLSKCQKGSSSGSTGHPVHYYHDKIGKSANIAAINFCKYLSGFELGSTWINIWGNPHTVNVDWEKTSSKIKSFFFNEIKFPAYKLHDLNQYDNLRAIIEKYRPDYMYGYTNAIYLFSQYLQKKSIRYDFFKGILTTAENLFDNQKVLIERHLGKIFDQYGCSEIKGIAAETIFNDGYRIIEPHVFLEAGENIDSSGVQKIIITDLNNKVMPFIRYQNDDLAVFDQFNQYKKIKKVIGRVSDIIHLPNGGNLVVPSFFGSTKLKELDNITQYQITKYNEYIKVNIHTRNSPTNSQKKAIINYLKIYIPDCIQYKVVFNENILINDNGKFKLVVDKSS